MKFLFLLSFMCIFYAYLGYPLLIFVVAMVTNTKVSKNACEPSVTFLITAYNEEKNIKAKLENTLDLDYPKEKMQILIVSDNSIDKTDEIIKEFEEEGVSCICLSHRVGKTEAQNRAVKIAKGEIIVFSDADSLYNREAIRKIVRNFSDPTVGCVAGMCKYVNAAHSSIGWSTKIYWWYELLIKSIQTRIRSLSGVSGCIYALRKDLFVPLPSDIISDFIEPMKIIEKGFRVVYEPEAIAFERTKAEAFDEFSMRVRVISRGMAGMVYMKSILNPIKFGLVSFQIISHKIFRWLVPVFMLLLFISNAFLLQETFFKFFFFFQVVFYCLGALGYAIDVCYKKKSILSLPQYFIIVNLAAFISLIKTLQGRKIVTWETKRS